MKKCMNPTYRSLNKKDWLNKKGFNYNKVNRNSSPVNGSAWNFQNSFNKTGGLMPYRGALQTIGQEFLDRKRNKSRETSPKAFDGMIPKDNFRNDYTRINSLGAGQSIDGQI